MVKHVAQWTTAAPLWADLAGIGLPGGINAAASTELDQTRQLFLQPAILRFTSDEFMEELITLMENAPDKFRELRAIRETWRGPAADIPAVTRKARFARPLELRKLALQHASSAKNNGGLRAFLKQRSATMDVFGTISPALKLYQPAHMRHYLVAANLVCQATGLPDRMLNSTAQERVGFVVRRLIPQDTTKATSSGNPYPADEYAFARSGGKWTWAPVGGGPKKLVDGEERQAMFPLTYQQADGHKRRMFAGVIPVGRRETYMSASRLADLSPESTANLNYLVPGEQLFVTQVFEPWKRLIEIGDSANRRYKEINTAPGTDVDKSIEADETLRDPFCQSIRDQIQGMSWLILLDFARLLQQYLPHVWEHVISPSSTTQLEKGESEVLAKLQGATLDSNLRNKLGTAKTKAGLVDALVAICGGSPYDQAKADAIAKMLETATKTYDSSSTGNAAYYPQFLFPLADLLYADPLPPRSSGETIKSTHQPDISKEYVDFLRLAIKSALKEQAGGETATPPQPLGAQPVMDPAEGWFVLRCVMERPECDPTLSPPTVSEPTEPFQMAGFFDPDAPARPIRINLPVDTTPAGLRKFDKNAAFVLSDVLCGQVQRAKGLSFGDLVLSVLPWPFHKDLPNPQTGQCTQDGTPIGMICTLSIPIITICALILLIIIVTVLDYIFHWLPYLIMCFPLPGFSAKESS